MADFPKKQQQCLIPKYLLDYLGEVNELHPDPSDLGGGDNIEAGTGIVITGDETKTISVDDETVAMVANLDPVAFSGSYNDLSNKPDLSVYELKEDAFTGDYEDLTNKPDLSIYELKSDAFSGNYNDLTNKPTIPTKTSELTNDSGYLVAVTWNDIYNKPNFATVATTGDYDDLTNKPTIPVVPTNISAFNNDAGYITGIDSSDVISALGYTPGTSNFSGDYDDLTDKPDLSVYELKSEAFSGDYNDLTNKPTIPTVGNGTITIKKNNTNVGTFTTNQSSNKSINITVPTDTSDLTNGAGFITAAQVPAGWEVVDVYQTQGSTPVSAADLAKLAGDNVCIRYNLDAIATGAYELFYKKGSAVLYNGYEFDNLDLNYNIGTSYIGFGQIYVNATTGAWSYTEDNRAYAGHKIESGSGLVEGSTTTSYGKTLAVDTSVIALKTDIPSTANFVTTNTNQTVSAYKTFSNALGTTWKSTGANNRINITPANVYITNGDDEYPERLHLYNNRIAAGNFSVELLDSNSTIVGKYSFPNKTGTVALTSEIPTVPTTVSSFTNDAGYITANVSTLTNYYDKTYIDNIVGDIETLLAAL